MGKTSVMVEFSICGENFEPDYITKQLNIIPCETYLKGDLVKNGKIVRKETSWSISTDYEDSYDINEQLEKISDLLNRKTETLLKLKQELSVDILFMITVKIKNNETPAMYLKKPFIHFLSILDAEIGFDVYVYNESAK